MDFTPTQKKIFVLPEGTGFGTFTLDRFLPKLPVPSLDETLQKYLDSIHPFADHEEFKATEDLCRNFERNEKVQELQRQLEKRSEETESWLAQWWLDYAYLKCRDPLIPFLNVGGPYCLTNSGPDQLWPAPVSQDESLRYCSLFVYHLLMFRKLLRQERLRPDSARNGTPFNMHQFRKLFNTTRIPKIEQDILVESWTLQREGECPTHIVVLRKGHLFVMDPFHGDDPLTAPELERCFQCICEDAEGLSSRPRISSLTRVNRDEWSENRNYLISLHNCNRESLKVVEDCMFMVILDEEQPSDESEVCQKLITGLPDNRWADKSLSVIQFANGFGGISCDHSPMDAMVGIIMSHFIHIGIKDMQGRWPGDFQGQNRDVKRPKLLQWKIDDKLEAAIDNGRKMAENLSHDVLLKRKAFKVFGKTGIKKLHINPDTFVQMALQLAYYRLHDRPAPTYETATTRKFRLGRTETLRSCSQDVVAFLVAMEDISTDVSKKRKLLETAISTHNKNMKEAKEGRGCDRHLLGLSILALQNGYQQVEEIKAFYSDPSFFKSGGGGNFLLSTSTSGYTPMAGGTTSMVENGYGVFYNFEEDKIWIWVTSYRRSTQTSTEKFLRAIETSLTDLYTLLSSRNSKI